MLWAPVIGHYCIEPGWRFTFSSGWHCGRDGHQGFPYTIHNSEQVALRAMFDESIRAYRRVCKMR